MWLRVGQGKDAEQRLPLQSDESGESAITQISFEPQPVQVDQFGLHEINICLFVPFVKSTSHGQIRSRT